jgi:hypothetical protein
MTSRHPFITLFSAAFGSSLLLAGCLGNPPDRSGSTASAPKPDPAAAAKLETTTIKLGYIPILEAAPLVVGVQKGFFAKHGLKVELAKQASWPAARDNVVLGSAGGGIDGGQWQLPMPHLITEGIITDGRKVPMSVLAQLIARPTALRSPTASRPRISALICPGVWTSSSVSLKSRAASSAPPTPSPTPTRTSGSATGWPPAASILTKTLSC